jgi:hypothetical protein
MRVGEVNVSKGQRPGRRVGSRVAGQARALAGQNEVGPLALEVRGEEEVRVRDGYDGAVRLNGNGRYAVARVKGFTPRVKHDLTLIRSFSENPAPGMLLP